MFLGLNEKMVYDTTNKCAKNKFYCETYPVYLIMSLNGLCSTLLKAQSNSCMLLWPISSVAIRGLL